MRLEEFPRPKGDNGRGLHWSPSPYPPVGSALDFWIDELHAMHIKWLKVVDDGRGSSAVFCERLIKEGIMPVVRLERARPHPRRLSPEEKDAIRRLVDVGVRYFEIDHEPDVPSSWGEAMPPNWFFLVIRAFIEDADFVIEAGGLPGIPAMELRPHHNPVRAIVEQGRGDLFERGTWWAVHNYTLNRPLEYPDDEINRTGRPVTDDEYEQHYPWGWNEPRDLINRWRAEGMQPGATLADDPFCFRAYELAGLMAQEVLGHAIPVISTEGGAVTGVRDDRRYPRLDPWTAAEWTVRINEFLQREAPPWYFTLCHWLIADRRIDPSRPHAWEPHSWYTHWWDEVFGFRVVLPVVERVKAMPSIERARPAPADASPAAAPPQVEEEEEPMPRPTQVVGRVHDETGAPLAHLVVELRPIEGDPLVQQTDERGQFRFEEVPPGTYRVIIPEHGAVGSVVVTLGEVQEMDIRIERAPSPPQAEEEGEGPIEVEERVAEEPPATPETQAPKVEEAPSPAAETVEAREAEPETEAEAPAPAREEETEEAVATEEPPPAEEVREVPVREREEAPQPTEARVSEEVAEPTAVAIPPAAEEVARGSRVVGHAPGARAGIVMRLKGESGETWEVEIDEARRFEFTDLPPGVYTLEMEGIGPVRERIELDGRNTVEVVFPVKGIIQGLVMGGTPEMMAELVAETYGWTRAVALSPQGQYRFVELPPGTYHVNVEGHKVGPVTITGDETVVMPTLDVRPPHRASLRGKVVNEEGEVLPDIPVRLVREGEVIAATETALNGTFSFENMPPGDYHLVVVGPPDVVRPVHLEQDAVVEQHIELPSPEALGEPEVPPAEEEGEEEAVVAEEAAPEAAEPVTASRVEEEVISVIEEAEPVAREERAPAEKTAVEARPAEEVAPTPEVPTEIEEESEEEVLAPPAEVAPPVEEIPAVETPGPLEQTMSTYVLLPPSTHPLCRPVLLAALPYLRRGRVVAGFRVDEAERARQVLIVGDESIHSQEVEERLRGAGCEVDRVAGNVAELVVIFRTTAQALKS